MRVYAFEDGQHASVAIPTVTGEIQTTFDVRREGRFITVDHSGKPGAWQVLLAGVPSIDSVEGGAAASSPNGVLLTPKRGASSIKISLKVVI